MTNEAIFMVKMHCGGCENAVQTILRLTDGVLRADANHRQSEVRVQFDPQRVSEDELRAKLHDSGFTPA